MDVQLKADAAETPKQAPPAGKKKQRNGTIDLLRFYFTIAVVMAHIYTLFLREAGFLTPMRNGHISVELFFILSGFLMTSSCMKASKQGTGTGPATFSFLRHKYQTLYPAWFLAWLVFMVFYFIRTPFRIAELWKSVPSILMISNLGFLETHNVAFGWYIPTMLLGMAILYPLCYRFKKTFLYCMAPLIALFSAVFLFQRNGKILANQEEWLIVTWPHTIRALCGLCLGCCAWTVTDSLKKWTGKLTVAGITLLSCAELLCWAVPVVGLWNGVPTYMHLPYMLCFTLGTAIAFSDLTWQSRIIRGSFFSWLGRISYGVYLAQILGKELTPLFVETSSPRRFIAVYLLIAVAGGIALYYLAQLLTFLCRTIRVKTKPWFLKQSD